VIISSLNGYGKRKKLGAPKSTRVQPSSVLDVPCDLTLKKM